MVDRRKSLRKMFGNRVIYAEYLDLPGGSVVSTTQDRLFHAPAHVYTRSCLSVGRSVGHFVGWSIAQTFDDPLGATIGLQPYMAIERFKALNPTRNNIYMSDEVKHLKYFLLNL